VYVHTVGGVQYAAATPAAAAAAAAAARRSLPGASEPPPSASVAELARPSEQEAAVVSAHREAAGRVPALAAMRSALVSVMYLAAGKEAP